MDSKIKNLLIGGWICFLVCGFGFFAIENQNANARLAAIAQHTQEVDNNTSLSLTVQSNILQGFWKQYQDTNTIQLPFPNERNGLTTVIFKDRTHYFREVQSEIVAGIFEAAKTNDCLTFINENNEQLVFCKQDKNLLVET